MSCRGCESIRYCPNDVGVIRWLSTYVVTAVILDSSSWAQPPGINRVIPALR